MLEGEALGLLDALRWVCSIGYQRVIFEVDEKCILDSLKDGHSGRSEYGSIVSSCRDLLSLEESFSVQFSHRQVNVLAHALAKTSCQFLSSHSWFSLPVQFTWLLSATCFSINIYIYIYDLCDALEPEGPVDHRQPAETYVSHTLRPIHE